MASLLQIHCSFNFNPKPNLKINPNKTPARDLVIDFGKYKGKMLGSLPSKYLTWVSKTLRAGDSLHWAELADQVLEDPVYKDRVEWEFAESVLSGDDPNRLQAGNPVGDLLEISERFGWDNADKIGWGKIDFGLLGTSKGGRIPRVKDRKVKERQNFNLVSGKREVRRERRRVKKMDSLKKEVGIGAEKNDEGAVIKNPFPGRAALLEKIHRGKNGI